MDEATIGGKGPQVQAKVSEMYPTLTVGSPTKTQSFTTITFLQKTSIDIYRVHVCCLSLCKPL